MASDGASAHHNGRRAYDKQRRDTQPWRNWYKLAVWLTRRAAQLASQPHCRMCQVVGTVKVATIADHVIPHRCDWTLFICGELQSLCKYHHDSTKKMDERRGYSTEVGLDGYRVDPAHPSNSR